MTDGKQRGCGRVRSSALFASIFSRAGGELRGLCVQAKAKGLGDLQDGSKGWVSALTERFVQALATEPGVARHLRHALARAISPSARAMPAASSGASASHASRYAAISSGVRNCSATSYGMVFVLAVNLDVVLRMTALSQVSSQSNGGLDVLLLR